MTVDENVNPGRYGFRIEHEEEKTHYFSSDEKVIVRDWMKAIMKATIERDYTSMFFALFRTGLRCEIIVRRSCHIVMQYSDDPADGRTSYESSTSSSFA